MTQIWKEEGQNRRVPWEILALLILLAFWPMFLNGFGWGRGYIGENPAVWDFWTGLGLPHRSNIIAQRPVMVFSLALDHALWGTSPFGFHLTNLILHLLCTAGVVLMTQRVSRSRGAGFLAGALFALHPGHAEGVIAFEGRSDLLVTLFVLAGFWSYLSHRSAGGRWKTLLYLASLVAYFLACFSKESGLVLLGLLILYEGFVSGRSTGTPLQRALRLGPFLLIALFYWWSRGRALGGETVGSAWWGGGPYKSFLMGFEVYARYLGLLVFPWFLSPEHAVPVPGGFWDLRVLGGMILLLGSLGVAVWNLRKHPWPGFLASWFLIGLLPVANLIPIPGITILAERWLYLPSVGACVLGGWGAWILYRQTRGWARTTWSALIAMVLILFGIRTGFANPAYRNEESLGKAILAGDPESRYSGHFLLGKEFWKQGRLKEAEREFRSSIELDPAYAQPHIYLGLVLGAEGRAEEEERELREALGLKTDPFASTLAHNHLGSLLASQGRLEEAEQEYRAALRVATEDPSSHKNLGTLLWKQGRLDEAAQEYREAIQLRPDFSEAHYSLGTVLEKQGKKEEAEREFRAALRWNLNIAEVHASLGNVLEEQGKKAEAEREYREALRLNPEDLKSLENLAETLDDAGRREEAGEFWEKAKVLETRPDWIEKITERLTGRETGKGP